MKKSLILIATLLISSHLFAQHTMADLFNGKANVVFLGVDYTQAKYIGKVGFTDPDAIKNQHIVSWNTLIESESKKFSLAGPLKIKSDKYQSEVDDMVKLNKNVDVAGNITETEYSISEEQVRKHVSKYNLSEKDGIGVVYVAESLNKTSERFTAWVTFLDLSTRKILLTERIEAKAGGIGFRNFWAGGVYNINKAIGSKYYKQWSKANK